MPNLSKTKETLHKEKELFSLMKKITKVKADIERLKTRRQDFINDILTMRQQFAQSSLQNAILKTLALCKEIQCLWQQIKNDPKVSRRIKKEFTFLGEDFLSKTLSFLHLDEHGNEVLHEKNPPQEDPLKMILTESSTSFFNAKEQKEIRKIFLKIANRLHPDKTTDESKKTIFHELMQRANDAYKQNDISALLEIEEKIANADKDVFISDNTSETASLIDKKLQEKQTELELLTAQKENLATQLKELKNSPLGNSLKEFKWSAKMGLMEELDELAQVLCQNTEILEDIKFIFKQILVCKKLTREIADLVAEITRKQLKYSFNF